MGKEGIIAEYRKIQEVQGQGTVLEEQEAIKQRRGRWHNRGYVDPGLACAYVQRCTDRYL
jgi:hypothetical protein